MNEFHFISKLLPLLPHDVREALDPTMHGCSIYLIPMCEGLCKKNKIHICAINSPFQQAGPLHEASFFDEMVEDGEVNPSQG